MKVFYELNAASLAACEQNVHIELERPFYILTNWTTLAKHIRFHYFTFHFALPNMC